MASGMHFHGSWASESYVISNLIVICLHLLMEVLGFPLNMFQVGTVFSPDGTVKEAKPMCYGLAPTHWLLYTFLDPK